MGAWGPGVLESDAGLDFVYLSAGISFSPSKRIPVSGDNPCGMPNSTRIQPIIGPDVAMDG